MIKSIIIKKVATYDKTGIQVNDLKKVNFIYGANGCGKTTISNFLYNLTDNKFNHCSLSWQNSNSVATLVYNKEFRERNFGKGKLGGIFTLGEATAEQIKNIEDKTEELTIIKAEEVKKKDTHTAQVDKKETLVNEFRETTWAKTYKKYEPTFKEAFTGTLQKESFKNKLLQEFASNTSALDTFVNLNEKAKTIFGEIPKFITPINDIAFDRILEIENSEIWKKIIVGKADVDIAKLIQKININDWVNQGREYLQEDKTCPFCQEKTITEDFVNQLESFFDETYLNDIKSIKDLKQEYNSLTQNLINELNGVETFQKDFKDTKLNNDKFSAYLKTLISQNATTNEFLNSKIKEPSRSIELNSLKEQLDLISELIGNANEKMKKHNDIVKNFNTERNNLVNSIWKLIIEEYKTEIVKFNTDKDGLEKGIIALQTQIALKRTECLKLDAEIKKLSKDVTSIQPTIDEINRLLQSYGFLNFEIVPATTEEGFYKIQREDGTIAETTLSEGEITFITFLYFLQLAKGGISEEVVNDERILVIDDPISSLDSNVLFVVSTLIKEIIKNIKSETGYIKQIILLTHNVYFHKEVSYEGLNRKGEKSNFWILRKNNKVSTIHFYEDKNPIQSSYELLWREIREWENNSGITIQNTLRRVLENYFSILGSKRDDVLINKFPTQEEREICRSLLSWSNEGSHTLPDDLFVEAPDGTITKYLDVFKKIFTYSENTGHYNMMMNIN